MRVILTGVKDIDAILATMERREVRKAITRATDRTITEYVLPQYRRHIEQAGFVDTGATRDVAKKRRVQRSRTRLGSELYIDRDRVVRMRRARGGRIGRDAGREEDFFHPVAIEFGTPDRPAQRPLRRALTGSRPRALAEFHRHLRTALAEVAARGRR